MNNARIDWIDNLKFLGMFYVYLGHFMVNAGPFYAYVFSFHVPLFFFISGIFYSKCTTINQITVIAKKAFQKLIVPYAIFSIISLVVISIYSGWSLDKTIDSGTASIYGIRNIIPAWALWFLPCLFIMTLYHCTLLYVLRSLWCVLIVSLVINFFCVRYSIAVKPSWFFNADSALYYLVYFSTGAVLSDFLKDLSLSKKSTTSTILFSTIFLASLMIALIVYFKGALYFYGLSKDQSVQTIIKYTLAVTLFIPNIFASMWITSPYIAKLGRATLVLCGTEQILKIFISCAISMVGLKVTLSNPINTILYTAMCFAVAYFTTVRVYNIFEKNKKNLAVPPIS